jgi:hypothetical protein
MPKSTLTGVVECPFAAMARKPLKPITRRQREFRKEEIVSRRKVWIPAVVVTLVAVGLIAQASAGNGRHSTVLRFKTMAGVVGPYVGTANPIRGIPGGGLPWSIAKANGMLRENGDLEVKVKGLVIPVPPFNGTNPSPTFRVVVSCMSIAGGAAVTVNQVTAPFPATTTGNAKFKGNVSLPSPCIAPIVFVTAGTGAPPQWFSVTGA